MSGLFSCICKGSASVTQASSAETATFSRPRVAFPIDQAMDDSSRTTTKTVRRDWDDEKSIIAKKSVEKIDAIKTQLPRNILLPRRAITPTGRFNKYRPPLDLYKQFPKTPLLPPQFIDTPVLKRSASLGNLNHKKTLDLYDVFLKHKPAAHRSISIVSSSSPRSAAHEFGLGYFSNPVRPKSAPPLL